MMFLWPQVPWLFKGIEAFVKDYYLRLVYHPTCNRKIPVNCTVHPSKLYKHPCDSRSLHRGQEATNHSRESQAGYDSTPGRGKSRQYSNLNTQRAEIGKTAEGIAGDGKGSLAKLVLHRSQLRVGNEFIGDKFDPEQPGYLENFMSGNAHKEGHRIEDVSEDEFQSQLVDTKATTDPGQESIKGVNKGKDRQYIC